MVYIFVGPVISVGIGGVAVGQEEDLSEVVPYLLGAKRKGLRYGIAEGFVCHFRQPDTQ